MTRAAVVMLVMVLAIPSLHAQESDFGVVQTRRAFVAAFNSRVADVLERLFAEDAVLVTDTARLNGRTAIAAHFRNEFARASSLQLIRTQLEQSGPVATEAGRLRLHLQSRSGRYTVSTTDEGRYRMALSQTAEDWQINYLSLRREEPRAARFDMPEMLYEPRRAPQSPPPPARPNPPQFGIVPL